MTFFKIKTIFIDFVLMNIFINAFFYIVTFGFYQGTLTLSTIQQDLFVGLAFLGVLCTGFGFDNVHTALIKGFVDIRDYKTKAYVKRFPTSNVKRTLILMVLVLLIIFPFFSIIPASMGMHEINHTIGFTFKVLSAAIAAGCIGYLVIDFTIYDYQKLQEGDIDYVS